MYLTKWEPFESLANLHDEMDRLFHRKLTQNTDQGKTLSAWYPRVDIREDNEGFYFDVEVPGIEKGDLDVKIEDNVLSVKGERKNISEDKKKNYYRIEREFGCFNRSFSLPETADAEKVNADYKNGMLFVKIAKKEAAKPKKIQVNIG